MKNLISLLFCLIVSNQIVNCLDCDSFFHLEENRSISLTINDLILGTPIETENRFMFECISNIQRSLSDHFEYREGQLFLLEPYINLYYPGDIIKILFLDESWHILPVLPINKRKIIEINIVSENIVCDTIAKIIYQNTKINIEKLVNGKVDEIDLFDKLINNSIEVYLASIPQLDTTSFKELCINEYKILDWINDSGNYGFKSKSYKLPPNIKSYLGIIARSITEKIKGKEISKKQIKIKCIGFADIESYGKPELFEFSKTGLIQNNEKNYLPYSMGNLCESNPNNYFDLNDNLLNNSIGNKLFILENNCDLSTVRAFSTISYLSFLLEENGIDSDISFEYRGAGEIVETDYAQSRRIEVFMVLKTVEK